MRILITGCNGFIGKNLTDAFKKEHDIIGLGRAEISRADVREYISCDIADRQRLSECIQKYSGSIDIVIHAAAEISDDVEKLYNTNCLGTQNIADFAKTAGVSCFVYISSVPVIGIPQYGKTCNSVSLHKVFWRTDSTGTWGMRHKTWMLKDTVAGGIWNAG